MILVYKVTHCDFKLKQKEKYFLELEKAKNHALDIIKEYLRFFDKNESYKIFSEEEFNKKISTNNSNYFNIISSEYPVVVFKLNGLNSHIQTARIDYYYIQEGKEYAQSFEVEISSIEVEN